jgi:hypothetical protein
VISREFPVRRSLQFLTQRTWRTTSGAKVVGAVLRAIIPPMVSGNDRRLRSAAWFGAPGETAVEPTIDTKLAVEAILYTASLPLDANVLFMTLMATEMPFVGRG